MAFSDFKQLWAKRLLRSVSGERLTRLPMRLKHIVDWHVTKHKARGTELAWKALEDALQLFLLTKTST